MEQIEYEHLNSFHYSLMIIINFQISTFFFSNSSSFYQLSRMDDEYILSPRFQKIGQICAVLFAGRWHRGEIVDVYTHEKQVKVSVVQLK